MLPKEEGRIVGMAMWFLNSPRGRDGENGIYIEDFYVRPEAHALEESVRELITELARPWARPRSGYERRRNGRCSQLERDSPPVSRSHGAVPMAEWTGYRLSAPTTTMAGEGCHGVV